MRTRFFLPRYSAVLLLPLSSHTTKVQHRAGAALPPKTALIFEGAPLALCPGVCPGQRPLR